MSETKESPGRSWDERYREGDHTRAAPLAFIAGLAAEGGARKALDLACGAGRHALALARSGWQVTAVDGSRVAIELLQRAALAEGLNIQCIVADLEKGEFPIEPNSWDLIVDSYFLDRSLLPAIRQGVRNNGRAAFAFPREDERPGVRPMSAAYLMGRGELAQHFSATNWDVEHVAELEPDLPDRARLEMVVRRVK